jgi:hypothetical protein
MLFCVKAKMKENPMLQPEQLRELSIKQIELMLKYQQEDIVLYNAHFADRSKDVLFIEVESNEKLDKFLSS